MKVLSSSRPGLQCHPKSLGLTGGLVVTEIGSKELSGRPSVNQMSTQEMGAGSHTPSGHQGSLPSP